MSLLPFNRGNMLSVSEALNIAEDKIGDFYKLSLRQWKRHRFSVRTLAELSEEEIISDAFALLEKRYRIHRVLNAAEDHYFICLQDHEILKATRRDKDLTLLPLLVYVFTHELVHIVRFCNFVQRFDAKGKDREREERIVHSTTYDILKNIAMPNLDYVLDSYQDHRVCEMATS
jgi:undecaprenyl pyrophosphate synthase